MTKSQRMNVMDKFSSSDMRVFIFVLGLYDVVKKCCTWKYDPQAQLFLQWLVWNRVCSTMYGQDFCMYAMVCINMDYLWYMGGTCYHKEWDLNWEYPFP